MKLRLLLFEACDRRCRGCCNKQWDLAKLPVCTDFRGYDMIMLTGGEPMLNPRLVLDTIAKVREQNAAPIVVYTACVSRPGGVSVLRAADGMTLTLHNQKDVMYFSWFNQLAKAVMGDELAQKSLRLNVFRGVVLRGVETDPWKVKRVKWIANCPLPPDEVFMRLLPV